MTNKQDLSLLIDSYVYLSVAAAEQRGVYLQLARSWDELQNENEAATCRFYADKYEFQIRSYREEILRILNDCISFQDA